MKRFGMVLCALLALVCACAAAQAEGEYKLFTPGEDLVIVDQDGVKVMLMGEQPEEIYKDGKLQLNLSFESSLDESINFYFGGSFNGIAVGDAEGASVFGLPLHPGAWTDYATFDSDAAAALADVGKLTALRLWFHGFSDGKAIDFTADTGDIYFDAEAAQAAADAAAAAENYEPLDVGSKGDAVQALQQKLIDLGYLDGEADGAYGKGTAGAVEKFQAAEGLQATGAADPLTQAKLFAK